MLRFVEGTLEKAKIPEIRETWEEQTLSVKELKEKYTKYAHRHFVKQPPLILFNQDTKWSIEITTRVIKEWWRKSRTRPRIIAIQLLDVMIETAILVKTGQDTKNTPGIESVSEFENHCKIDGKLHKIHIVVKKQPNRHFVYYYGAINIEIQ
jgi:hypothetical protein